MNEYLNNALIGDWFDDPADVLAQAELNANSDWEFDFIASLKARFEKFGSRTAMSARQMQTLSRIANI